MDEWMNELTVWVFYIKCLYFNQMALKIIQYNFFQRIIRYIQANLIFKVQFSTSFTLFKLLTSVFLVR